MEHDRKNVQSRAWRERARSVIPGCAQTFSKSPTSFVEGVTPSFLHRAEGAHIWDVDGNSYIDYGMGLGAVILGHADPVVNEAVKAQLAHGTSFTLPHTLEVEVAELLRGMIPCAEMARFGKNGSDATSAAVRVARAYTRRDLVACAGYHGWQDWYIGSTSRNSGVPLRVQELTKRFAYGDLESLARIFRENPQQIACVILEPITFDLPPSGYLEQVKQLCHKNGTLLIFDEVITGFRIALGGAQEFFQVQPDLASFGKAMANGFPLSAVVGRADVMRLFEEVFFSTTHGGEALSLAACRTTIQEIKRRDGIAQLRHIGTRLQELTNSALEANGLTRHARCVGLPAFTTIRFQGQTEQESLLLRSLFMQETVKAGILTQGSHMLSLAHDEQIVTNTIETYHRAFAFIAQALREGGLASHLSGPPVRPVIRQV